MRARGGRVETEGLHFIYRVILPQIRLLVNRFSKFFPGSFKKIFLCFSAVCLPRERIRFFAKTTAYAPKVALWEQAFGTTCMSIGKIAKMLLKKHGEILNRSAFHEISRQKSSTLLIYKSCLMRYNNLARRKRMFRRYGAAQVGLCGISISWYQACKDAKRCTCSVRIATFFTRTDTEAGSVLTDSVFFAFFEIIIL